jgi:DNA polymerase III epsilon subunit-like protein
MQRAMWFFEEAIQRPRPPNLKLATLCHYFDIPFHAAEVHDALGDVRATLRLYEALRRHNSSELANPGGRRPSGVSFDRSRNLRFVRIDDGDSF